MKHRYRPRTGFAGVLVCIAACSIGEETVADAVTTEFLHGEWCQIVEIVEDGEPPEVERHTWTFQPGGTFLRHFKHNKPLLTTWVLDGNDLRIPMLGNLRLTRVSENEFQFRRFVLNRVVRGACDGSD